MFISLLKENILYSKIINYYNLIRFEIINFFYLVSINFIIYLYLIIFYLSLFSEINDFIYIIITIV